MQHYVDTYGKEFLIDILNICLIQKHSINNEEFRNLLLKHKIIKPSTKYIFGFINYDIYSDIWAIQAKNGRGTYIIYMRINNSELQQLTELLS